MKIDEIKDALATIRSAKLTLQEQIADVLAKEQNCAAQIADLQAMPIALGDFSQYLRKHIDSFGVRWFAGRSARNLLTPRSHETAMNARPWRTFEGENVTDAAYEYLMPELSVLNKGDAFSALCFVMPEALHEKLMDGYRETIGARWGNEELPTVEQRRASIAELVAQRDDYRAQRETLTARLHELDPFEMASGQIAQKAEASGDGALAAAAPAKPLKGQRFVNPDLVSQR